MKEIKGKKTFQVDSKNIERNPSGSENICNKSH
jgi:hypothetical protein